MEELGSQKQIVFHPFRLDSLNQCLYRGHSEIQLRPKTMAVLEYLLNRPGQLVTKAELLNAVWPDTYVTDAVLKVSIREIRDALGDDQKKPGFIETAHRRGYRFIGKLGTSSKESPCRILPIGREREINYLQDRFQMAMDGTRQVVFVTGESGIGKTTLVESFLEQISAGKNIAIARGQCLEQFGISEAYMPVLEAISRLCSDSEYMNLAHVLQTHAPMWLLQMPGLMEDSERATLHQATIGGTRERMLREMSQALEFMTTTTPLILFLEDLHWSDYSTVDLISCLARQKGQARLLIIGTLRPSDVITADHPLKSVKQELQSRQLCSELALQFLSEQSVQDYINQKFPVNAFPTDFVSILHRRTDGHPIFIVNLVDYLVTDEKIVEIDGTWKISTELREADLATPDNIRQMIGKQIDDLNDDEQKLLHAASVAGMKFSAAAVAAALSKDLVSVEELFGGLVKKHQFLKNQNVDEDSDAEFEFLHAIHQDVIYNSILPAYRRQLHKSIGDYEEMSSGPNAIEIASELAMHFSSARDFQRSVKYLYHAAENANRRLAHREAAELANKGLEQLQNLPDNIERWSQEFCLLMSLISALSPTEGHGSHSLESIYIRALQTCDRLNDELERFRVLRGLRTFYLFRVELSKCREVCQQLVNLAEHKKTPALLAQAHSAMSGTLFHLGEFEKALSHSDKVFSNYDLSQSQFHLIHYKVDPGVFSNCTASWNQWVLGYPDRSLEEIQSAFQLAEKINHPESWRSVLFHATFLHQLRRDPKKTLESADALIKIAGDHDLSAWIAIGEGFRAWALICLGHTDQGIELLRNVLANYEQAGSNIAKFHFSTLLAESLLLAGKKEESLSLVNQVLKARNSDEGYYHEAELYRLKGELLGSESKQDARDYFHRAIEIAKEQKATSFELRSLIRLWKHQDGSAETRKLLQETFDWFTEGFDTTDLIEARRILQKCHY